MARKAYSGHKTQAYMMPNPPMGFASKAENHLALLQAMLKDDVDHRFYECTTMADGFGILRAIKSFGDFLAYQYVLDLNYGPHTDWPENGFTVAGPGANEHCRGSCRAPVGSPGTLRSIPGGKDHG